MSKHPLEEKWNTTAWDILSAIERGFRSQADVKGKLAEPFLFRRLVELEKAEKIGNLVWQDKDGHPDFLLRFKSRDLRMECKNVRSVPETKAATLAVKVELQKTRNNVDTTEPTRGYRADEFDILAACLFNRTGQWEYRFISTRHLIRRSSPMERFFQVMQTVPLHPDGFWRYDELDAFEDAIR